MFSVAILSCVVALVSGCCQPDQFTVHESEISLYVVDGISHLLQGKSVVYYDHANHRMSIEQKVGPTGLESTIHLVADFQKKLLYTMSGQNCTTAELPQELMLQCIPQNAVAIGSYFYDEQSKPLWVNAYEFDLNNNTYELTMTRDDCFPVRQSIYGDAGGVPHLFTATFTNSFMGIANVQTFDLFPGCSDTIDTMENGHGHIFGIGHGSHIPVG